MQILAMPGAARQGPPRHDPMLCGLTGPGEPPVCPGCIAERSARSAVCAELQRIAERFEAADRRAHLAGVAVAFGEDAAAAREAAEAERMDIAGEFWGAESALADLLLLLLRYAAQYQPDALRAFLADALAPELDALADSIARLEGRRR